MAETQDLSRLTTFQHHIEDMRNLVMCKICLKPLYEPFILSCGHTYCYGCLRSWFTGLESRKRKKNCPDCRNEVELTPAPNYILRDLVHMFIGRAELLPEDETVDEHVAGKLSEAETLASDKNGKGLFNGIFKYSLLGGPRFDFEDSVHRCPLCDHEVLQGWCTHCDYRTVDADPDFSDDESDSITIDESSIVSDESSGSGHNIVYGLPRHFYTGPRATDGLQPDIGIDGFSEPEYGTPHQYEHDEDEDEDDSFIDDQEVDEPDEVDDDALDVAAPLWMSSRNRRHWIPDEMEDEDSQDEDQMELANFQRSYRQNNRHPGGPIETANDLSDEDTNDQEQLTNYDDSSESNEGSRSSTPVARPVAQRRRPIVISDSDDDDDDDVEVPTHQTISSDVTSSNETSSESDDAEPAGPESDNQQLEESDSSGSDDSSTSMSESIATPSPQPPQSSVVRRQRLTEIRKRRHTSESRDGSSTTRAQPAYSRRW